MTSQFLTRRERRIFVDSSAFLAMLDADDEHHVEARAILEQLVVGRYRLYTTNVILIEAHGLILSTLGRLIARRFLIDVRAGNTVVVRVRSHDEVLAEAILTRYIDKDFSFADATSFAVMERLGITRAFSFDSDFAQYGFVLATPENL
jgi:predicted nucleic acid-binding protein